MAASAAAVLLLGVEDPLWGQRLVALPRLVARLPPAERPRTWWPCPELSAVQAPMHGGWPFGLVSGAGKF
jgi:hypothetical protein